MYSFVSEEIGTLIVNSVLLFLAFVVFLLVTLAILTARSMWSFNPETNILLNVPLHGTILTRPLLESELVIGAVILRGHLRIAGHHLGRCDIKDLPKEITVATSRTLSYYKLGASQRVAGDSGFAAYSRYRIGNYKLNTDHSSSSDNIALLVQ